MPKKKVATQDDEKTLALKAFEKRKKANSKKKRVRNADLYAGSPMYYYCETCGEEMALPESHTCAAPTHCKECKTLLEHGWI